MIYVSTTGKRGKSATEVALDYIEAGIGGIELTGGRFTERLSEELLNISPSIHFGIHNYFPPPRVPFVLNLASGNPEVASMSMDLAKSAIQLASVVGSPYYSFHAGFLIDPKVQELGGQIGITEVQDYDLGEYLFIERVKELHNYAKLYDIRLLIENNVLTAATLARFGRSPLLMASPKDINRVMSKLPDDISLLLDVGHLKVTARTLSLSLLDSYYSAKEWADGYHLSDNDGLVDSNNFFNAESWFWHHLDRGLSFYTIEVYNHYPAELYRLAVALREYLNH